MAVLKSGWVIVGSTPSTDGTTATKGAGCLLVFDANGELATVWSGSHINGPWGNMAVVDNGSTATLFVSMSGYDLPRPDQARSRHRRAGRHQQGDGAAHPAHNSRQRSARR